MREYFMNRRKSLVFLLIAALCFTFTACSAKETTTNSNIDIGSLTHKSIDIMGVTYELYDGGYALIKTILHENAQLGERVDYDGTEYIVLGFPNTKGETGAFGLGQTKSAANLVLPDSIMNVANYALAYCNADTIELPSALQTVGVGAFRECRNIETLIFPESVSYISASKLFQNCISLQSVAFPADCTIQFFNNTFEGCTSLKSATVPAAVDYIGGLSFYKCYALTSVIIEEGVQKIQSGAFMDCPALESLTIPNSVTIIEDAAFQGCAGLKEIVLPDGIADVSANLFTNLDRQNIDVSGLIIYVKTDLVSYVQSIYPNATVMTK